MEWLVLGAFCAALLLCVALGQSILYALAAGFVLFLLYGRRKGFACYLYLLPLWWLFTSYLHRKHSA